MGTILNTAAIPNSFILCVAVLAVNDAAPADAPTAPKYEVGARVVVIRETTLRVDNRALQSLPPGTSLTVEESQDGYLGVTLGRQGWVELDDVAPAEDAVEALEPAIAAEPDNVRLREIRMRYACWRDKWQVAIADSTALIRLEPKEPGHYLERAYALSHQGNYDKAIADCDEALRQDWQPAIVHLYRGWLWHCKDQPDQAIKDFDEALQHEASDQMKSKVLLYRGIAHREQGDWEKALSDFKDAIKSNWTNPEIFKERGYLNFRLERHRDAVIDYSAALFLSPNNASLYAARGESYRMNSEIDNALDDFNRALVLDPRHEFAYRSRGNLYADKGDTEKALADFSESLRIDPKSVQTYASRGRLYMKAGDLAKAEADVDKALEIDPKSANACYARAQLMIKERKYDEVKTAFQNALRSSPADVTLCNNFAWFLATCPEDSARDGQAAIKLAQRAAQMCNHREPATLGTLAAAYAEVGDFDAAITWLDRAMKADSKGEYSDQYKVHRELYLQHKPFHSTTGK